MVKEFKRQINANAQESYVSLVLGFLVVVVSGVLLYNFITKKTVSEPTVNLPTPTITEEVISTVSGTLTLTRQKPTTVPSVTPSPTVQPTATTVPTVPPTATPLPSATSIPTPTATSPTPPAEAQPHVVQKGETLWSLSQRYYGTGFEWRKIAEANKLTNPRIIEVGLKLTIPQGGQKGADISATATELPKSYTVVAGDSLWKIAIAHYGTGFEWVYIARQNTLTTPDLIYPGIVLQLPRPHATLDPPGGTGNPPAEQKN